MRKFLWFKYETQKESLWKVLIIGGVALLWFHLRTIVCDFLGIEPDDEKPFDY